MAGGIIPACPTKFSPQLSSFLVSSLTNMPYSPRRYMLVFNGLNSLKHVASSGSCKSGRSVRISIPYPVFTTPSVFILHFPYPSLPQELCITIQPTDIIGHGKVAGQTPVRSMNAGWDTFPHICNTQVPCRHRQLLIGSRKCKGQSSSPALHTFSQNRHHKYSPAVIGRTRAMLPIIHSLQCFP